MPELDAQLLHATVALWQPPQRAPDAHSSLSCIDMSMKCFSDKRLTANVRALFYIAMPMLLQSLLISRMKTLCLPAPISMAWQAMDRDNLQTEVLWHNAGACMQIHERRACPFWMMHLYLHEVAFARAWDHFFGPQAILFPSSCDDSFSCTTIE